MRKIVSIFICCALLVMTLPMRQASAYETPSQGTVVSGQTYSGVTPVDEAMNHKPARFELPVTQNSIIRIILYTQSESDTRLYIENEGSPYDKADNYGSFPGSCLTTVGDFYNPAPNVFSTSSYGVAADMRNTAAYTEVFGDIAKGNYYIIITGTSYSFKVIIEPLKYDSEFSNAIYTKETAAAYSVGSEQKGILIMNGIMNNNFINGDKSTNSWYKFTAGKGKYRLDLSSDGFFQGTATVLNKDGYPVAGNMIKAEAFHKFNNSDALAGTYEEHVAKAATYNTDFELPESGTYYVNINRRTWTSGSYMFRINSEATGSSGNEQQEEGYPEDGTSGEAEAGLSSIGIGQKSVSVKAGATTSLNAIAYYSDSSSEDITEFAEWTSSDKKVATVDENGVVKGIAAGTVTIKASLEGKTASVVVTVTASKQLTKITPQKATIYMKVGATSTNKITAYYSDGSKSVVTDKVVLKSSSASMKIYKNRELKAMKKGNYVVTVTYGGMKTSYKVVVK